MKPQLSRSLGLWSSTAIVVGITIGSGIFRTPASIGRLVPDPRLMLAVWVAGGAIALCGALSFAELGASLPETGGYYAYLREGWGPLAGFLFGWAQLVLIRASALGGIALVFGEYTLRSFGLDVPTHYAAVRLLAIAGIAFASIVNIVGVDVGARIVRISTVTKFSAIALLIAAAFALGGGHGASAAHFTSEASGSIGVGALGLALVSVLWAYDGFGDLSFVGGEVQNPQRNLPRATIVGTLAIIAIYVLANLAYLYVSPVDAIAKSPLVAADTMMTLFGGPGATLVSILVMISTFSSLNADMLATPRVFFAMADDGLFFKSIARIHPRFKTPHVAILLAAVLGAALVLSQTFERLSNTFILAIWPFYALSVAALFRLRRRRPELPRPYRVVGYPWVPALFIASVIGFVANALVNDPLPTLITFSLIVAGVPVYYFWFSSARRRPPDDLFTSDRVTFR